jgi:hypothetical protein
MLNAIIETRPAIPKTAINGELELNLFEVKRKFFVYPKLVDM